MTCQEQLVPYVRWSAQEQFANPNRYVIGVSLVTTDPDGEIATVQGYADITRARFAADGVRFVTSVRGVGHRTTTSPQTYLEARSMQPEPRKVIIQIDANHEKIRVRIGDVERREVVEDFLVECRDDQFVSVASARSHLLRLHYVEHTDSGWIVSQTPTSLTDDELPTIEAVDEQPEDTQPTPTPDDLERIEGIGPKSLAALNSIGITTYAQLAAYNPETLRAELDAAGADIGLNSVMTWPAQAALAAAGRWNALRYIQDELLSNGRLALPDNLQRINGIGPSLAAKLDILGITTFKQIADADPDQLEADLRASGARIPLGAAATWPEQAALAHAGGWLELETYQQTLNRLDGALEQADAEL